MPVGCQGMHIACWNIQISEPKKHCKLASPRVMFYICRTKPVKMAVVSGTVILLMAGAWLMSMQPAVEAKAKKELLITDVVRAAAANCDNYIDDNTHTCPSFNTYNHSWPLCNLNP